MVYSSTKDLLFQSHAKFREKVAWSRGRTFQGYPAAAVEDVRIVRGGSQSVRQAENSEVSPALSVTVAVVELPWGAENVFARNSALKLAVFWSSPTSVGTMTLNGSNGFSPSP